MKWLRVKDELPPLDVHVIGYCRTPHEKEFHVEPLLYEGRNWAYLFACNEGYGYAIEVTHWAPLPPPP